MAPQAEVFHKRLANLYNCRKKEWTIYNIIVMWWRIYEPISNSLYYARKCTELNVLTMQCECRMMVEVDDGRLLITWFGYFVCTDILFYLYIVTLWILLAMLSILLNRSDSLFHTCSILFALYRWITVLQLHYPRQSFSKKLNSIRGTRGIKMNEPDSWLLKFIFHTTY